MNFPSFMNAEQSILTVTYYIPVQACWYQTSFSPTCCITVRSDTWLTSELLAGFNMLPSTRLLWPKLQSSVVPLILSELEVARSIVTERQQPPQKYSHKQIDYAYTKSAHYLKLPFPQRPQNVFCFSSVAVTPCFRETPASGVKRHIQVPAVHPLTTLNNIPNIGKGNISLNVHYKVWSCLLDSN